MSGTGTVTNQGTLTISNNPNTTTIISAPIDHKGSLSVQSGTLQLKGNFKSSKAITVASNATLDFNAGTSTLQAGTTIHGTGTYSFTGTSSTTIA